MGSHRVGHDWSDLATAAASWFLNSKKKNQAQVILFYLYKWNSLALPILSWKMLINIALFLIIILPIISFQMCLIGSKFVILKLVFSTVPNTWYFWIEKMIFQVLRWLLKDKIWWIENTSAVFILYVTYFSQNISTVTASLHIFILMYVNISFKYAISTGLILDFFFLSVAYIYDFKKYSSSNFEVSKLQAFRMK